MVDLDNILPCNDWKHRNKEAVKQFKIVKDTAGFYYCPSTDQVIFVLAKGLQDNNTQNCYYLLTINH